MIKQVLFIVLAVLCLMPLSVQAANTPAVPAQQQLSNQLQLLELNLLGRYYRQDSPEQRVARLEQFIFGESKNSFPMDRRLQALSQYIAQPVAEQLPPQNNMQPSPPSPQANRSEESGFESEESWHDGDQPEEIVQQGPPSAEVIQGIATLESRLYRRTFPQEAPELRLNRLEMSLFNETAPEMTYEDRISRSLAVMQSQDVTQLENNGITVDPQIANSPGFQYSRRGQPNMFVDPTQQGRPVSGYGKNGPRRVKQGGGGFGGINIGGGGFGGRGGIIAPGFGGGSFAGGGGLGNSMMWLLMNGLMRGF